MCPSIENKLATEQGYEIWAIVSQFSSQLRVAGMGSVIGLDMPFILGLVLSEGVDRQIALHLLPRIEAGIVAALNEKE